MQRKWWFPFIRCQLVLVTAMKVITHDWLFEIWISTGLAILELDQNKKPVLELDQNATQRRGWSWGDFDDDSRNQLICQENSPDQRIDGPRNCKQYWAWQPKNGSLQINSDGQEKNSPLTRDETHNWIYTTGRLFISWSDMKGTVVKVFRTLIRRFEGLLHRQFQSQYEWHWRFWTALTMTMKSFDTSDHRSEHFYHRSFPIWNKHASFCVDSIVGFSTSPGSLLSELSELWKRMRMKSLEAFHLLRELTM